MQTVRSARRAGRLSRSAAEAARTVSIWSLRHVRMMRTAISPRLAMTIRRMGTRLACLAHTQERLAVFREGTVGDQDFGYGTADTGTYRVHQFHYFDDGDDRVDFHVSADFDE